jgi:hypothetical protein
VHFSLVCLSNWFHPLFPINTFAHSRAVNVCKKLAAA